MTGDPCIDVCVCVIAALVMNEEVRGGCSRHVTRTMHVIGGGECVCVGCGSSTRSNGSTIAVL